MPIDWDAYSNLLDTEFKAIKADLTISNPAANLRMTTAIVNGYVDAMSGGGDPLLKAPVILSPAGILAITTTIMAALTAGMAAPPMVALALAINLGIPLCWAPPLTVLNSASVSPLPGHVGHSPVSMVISPGIMLFVPPLPPQPDHMVFVEALIKAMKAHLLTVSGMHPAMILPPPAPPYPLPWLTYS